MQDNKCLSCIYSDKYGECKKGFDGYTYNCYFESKYIEDEEGNIIYSEEFEEDEELEEIL